MIPLRRRFALALVALVVSGLLFHAQVADALVTRGDSFMQAGRPARAARYYQRAVWWDPSSALAADRFAFVSFQLRSPAALAAGIAIASDALLRAPGNWQLLLDRALCFQAAGRLREARADFAQAAELRRDPQLLHFAGWAAFRSGDVSAAGRYWRAALRIDPTFAPASLALHRVMR